jgi:hypothetical protein
MLDDGSKREYKLLDRIAGEDGETKRPKVC